MKQLPCGIYRTTRAIGERVAAGVLVYYHNHGEPGPGVYLPRAWRNNRALFSEQGTTVPDPAWAESLEALAPEGLYRVVEPFACCEKRCVTYEEDLLVQLGYNGRGEPILFIPELVDGELRFPERGAMLQPDQLRRLRLLKLPEGAAPPPPALHLN
jgi:hypothetical protein